MRRWKYGWFHLPTMKRGEGLSSECTAKQWVGQLADWNRNGATWIYFPLWEPEEPPYRPSYYA